MATAPTLERYLAQQGVHYDVVRHPHSHSSMETAEVSHVPGDRLAKSVVLEDDDGYLLVVLPSTQHVQLGKLGRELDRTLRLATESQLGELFADCERGAVPALGAAYGLRTIVDESLVEQPEIFFEAGDHEQLIRMDGRAFRALMSPAEHARVGHHTQRGHRG